MAEENSVELLFKLSADTSGVEESAADAESSLLGLRNVFNEQLGTLTSKGLELLDVQISNIAKQIPLVGIAVGDIITHFVKLGEATSAVRELDKNLTKIAQATGHTSTEVASFIRNVVGIKDEGQRADAVLTFLGRNLANTLMPTLELAAKSSKSFGDEVITAARSIGKSDEEISGFINNLVTATTRSEALARMTQFLGSETAKKLTPAMDAAAASIQKISQATNIPVGAVSNFINEFSKISDVAERNQLATGFFGEAVAQKITPELEKASTAMAGATGASHSFANAMRSVVAALGPVGLAIVGVVVQLGIMAIALKVVLDIGHALVNRLIEMAHAAAEFRGRLFDLSQQTGVNVETLSALEIVATTTGSSIQAMVASLIFFQRKIEEAKDPTSDTAAVFRELGIVSGDTNEAFKQALAGLFAIGEGSRQTAVAMQLFGRSSRTVLAILKESRGDLDAVIKKAKEFGILVSTEDAEAADKFNDSLAILNLQMRALIGKEAIPAALAVLETLSQELNNNREAFNSVARVIAAFANTIGVIAVNAIKLARIAASALNETMELLNLTFGNHIRLISFVGFQLGLLGDINKRSKQETDALAESTDLLVRRNQELKKAAEDRVKTGTAELEFLDAVVKKSQLSNEEYQRLWSSYKSLDEVTLTRIQRLGTERERLEALIIVKRRQLELDKEEARDPQGFRQKQIRQEIADEEKLRASREFATEAKRQLAKQEQEEIRRLFELNKATREQKLAVDKKIAEEEHKIELERIRQSRVLLLKKQEDLIISGKLNTKEETEVNAQLLKLNQEKFEADQKLSEQRKQLDHDFKIEEIEAEKRHQENKVNLFKQGAADRISQIRDELAQGTAARKALLEEELRAIELQQTFVARTSLEEALRRTDLEIEVRELFTKKLEDVLTRQTQLEEEHARKRIEILLTTGTEAALKAEDDIKEIEDAIIRRRRTRLEEDKASTVNVRERQRIQSQLDALQIEQTEVERQQSLRRREIVENEKLVRSAILTSQAQTTVQLIEQTEQSITNTIRKQADLRLITEETAAKQILKLRLDSIRAQEDLIRTEQQAAGLIRNESERAQRESELNNALRLLRQQRKEIVEQGNEDIDDARQKDLENERRYQEGLSRLQSTAFNAQREAIRSVIAILGGDARRRRELARAQLDLESAEEVERHRVIKENTDREILLRQERVRVIDQHLKTLRSQNKQESDDFKDANERRAELLTELEILHHRQESEETRHVASINITARAMLESGLFTRAEILKQLDIEKGLEDLRHRQRLEALQRRKDELEKTKELNQQQLEELKRINAAIEAERDRHNAKTEQQNQDQTKADTPDLVSGAFEGLGESSIKKEGDAIRELGKIAGDTFKGMAQAVGNLVQQWVLYGNTGPAAMRKIVAAALAAVSAEATVRAIMELAYGFAALTPWGAAVYGPAPLHFKSAALFAAVAAIAGVGGRALAGNAFSQGGTGAGAGGQQQSSQPQQPSPIELTRQEQQTTIRIIVHAEPGPGFNQHVINGIVRDIQTNGTMRNVIVETAGT